MIRILERSTIITKEFQLNYANNPDLKKQYKNTQGKSLKDKTDDDVEINTDDLSKYPLVYLNGVLIESTSINKLQLTNNSFVPTLKLEFTDPTNKLLDENFPVDNSIISIFKESTNQSYMGIKMDFKVTDFIIIKGKKNTDSIYYSIDASLDLDELYLMNYESYKGTSFEVLKKICADIGLGFATNIDNTSDNQVWINSANYKIEFLRDIIDLSYISDETFLFGYIDFYYNFNYVDIEKALNEDISTQKNLIDFQQLDKKSSKTQEQEVPLILTNFPDKTSTNLKIDLYTIENSSTNVNLTYGYRHRANYYDKNNDVIKKYAMDSISVAGDDKIVMKGNETNDILYNNMINGTWLGKLDTDNVHENFLHSKLQNMLNLKFLQKLKMTVRMNRVNYGLYRFQLVEVRLYNLGKWNATQEKNKNKKTTKDKNQGDEVDSFDETIINKLSGAWLITAINIIYDKEGGNTQELTLVKRELTDGKYSFPGQI